MIILMLLLLEADDDCWHCLFGSGNECKHKGGKNCGKPGCQGKGK